MKLLSVFPLFRGRIQYKRQEKGFSMIELLVVMAILGVLMSMGISAVIRFRKARQVDTIAYAVRDMIKDARGKAMSVSTSSTTDTGVWPVGYSVTIDSNYVRAQIIYDPGYSTVYASWTGVEGKIETYAISEVFPVEVSLDECNKVVFESVNGTMHVYDEAKLPGNNLCTIEFSLPGYSRQLQLQADEKIFEIR